MRRLHVVLVLAAGLLIAAVVLLVCTRGRADAAAAAATSSTSSSSARSAPIVLKSRAVRVADSARAEDIPPQVHLAESVRGVPAMWYAWLGPCARTSRMHTATRLRAGAIRLSRSAEAPAAIVTLWAEEDPRFSNPSGQEADGGEGPSLMSLTPASGTTIPSHTIPASRWLVVWHGEEAQAADEKAPEAEIECEEWRPAGDAV